MEKIFNIGIIGAGVVAERIINASKDHPRANVQAIYDKDREKLEEVAKRYSLNAYDSNQDILEDEDIDIIYLAVPPKYHYPLALDIFKSGKHFLCEKPLANSTEEAREMAEMSNKEGVAYGMNFPTLYRNSYLKMRELLDQDFLGKILRLEFQGYFTQWPRAWQQNPWIDSREQGGFTREVVTHYIQLMQRLFGDLEEIHSFIKYPEDEEFSEYSLIAKSNIGEIDVLINCLTDVGMKEDLSFNIIGDKGTIALKNWMELWSSNKDGELERIELEDSKHLVKLLDDFFKAIDGEASGIVDFKEGYRTHKVVEKLLKA